MARLDGVSSALLVSVVIAAYNEERFIAQTLDSILQAGIADEIIVIDDGSSDATPRVLAEYTEPVSVVTHAVNRGKGAALASGISRAKGDIIVLCDAHLLRLERRHLLALIEPLKEDRADVTLGVATGSDDREGTMRLTPTAILTGQRAYRRSYLLPWLAEMQSLGYGVETFLHTKHVRHRTVVVRLPGLVHLTKRHKSTPSDALACYVREAREIASAACSARAFRCLGIVRTARRFMAS